MSERRKHSKNSDGSEDITNGLSTTEKQNDCDEARPLQRNNRARRDSLAKIELQDNPPGNETSAKPKGTYGKVMDNLQMSEKKRLPFLLAIVICVLLLITLIILVAFWPQIPYYMKAEICVDKECMDASKQILTWANTSVNVCKEPYEWACGKFNKEYEDHTFYGIHKGEWNMESSLEYEEIRDLNLFISMLSNNELSYSSASILKSLYKSCREIETMDKSQADTLLKKAIKSSETKCSNRWKCLRDQYVRELRKQKGSSGSGVLQGSKWKYFDLMHFLRDSVAPREHSTSFEMAFEDSTDNSTELLDADDTFIPMQEDALDNSSFLRELTQYGEGSTLEVRGQRHQRRKFPAGLVKQMPPRKISKLF